MPTWAWIMTFFATVGAIVAGVKSIRELLGWMSKPYKKIHDKAESVERNLVRLTDKVNKNDITVRKLELLMMMEVRPNNEIGICRLYDEYKKLEENTFIDEIFDNYMKKRKSLSFAERFGTPNK